jgi:cyclic beta-1,2-glucan synthetase
MIEEPITVETQLQQPWREAGAALGREYGDARRRASRREPPPNRRKSVQDLIARAVGEPDKENAAWVVDNFRLIFGAEKEVREFAQTLRDYPVLVDAQGQETPRVLVVARGYLLTGAYSFDEADLTAFIDGYQSTAELKMEEVWALKPALELALVDRLTECAPREWPTLVGSLRKIGDMLWRDLFETASVVNRVLMAEPAGVFPLMDYESRDRYRKALAELAKHSRCTEMETAQAVIDLCRNASVASGNDFRNEGPASVADMGRNSGATSLDTSRNTVADMDRNSGATSVVTSRNTVADLDRNSGATSAGARAAARRAHIGYYLIDAGRPQLEVVIGYRPHFWARLRRALVNNPTVFYLAGIELLTILVVILILSRSGYLQPAYIALFLLVLPATQAATDFMNNLAAFVAEPRVLPKLDFSEGIPNDCVAMVAVPTLLINEAQVRDLALDLEIRFLANRDPNLYFALLTDSPDSDRPEDKRDALVGLCARLIEGLNTRYRCDGRSPFYLFHRHRVYNEQEGRWMGWERKRGKLLDLNQLLRGGFDAFPEKVGDLSVLASVKYIITLDTDTQLPRDSAAKLVGTIAHPLNRAVVDPAARMVVEGYGILQPRIGISVQSATRSRLASLYSGQTGFDIYTRAISDVYQDLFGEGIFTGKGIYEVDALRETLERRFPDNALLSHDLIEGAYARAALVSDIELIDDYPSHFSAYSRRKHRWMRGDWQIMRWTRARVPDYYGGMIRNPITLISQWKILDNLRRSLLEPALVLLLLSGWLWLPGRPEYWTIVTILMWSVPVFSGLFFSLLRVPHRWRAVPAWARETGRSFRDGFLIAVCSVIFLLHQALISMDAVVRAVLRVLVTRKKMLEWETAAEAEAASRPKSTVDIYMEWTPWISLALAGVVWLLRPKALPSAFPILGLWAISRPFSDWLNRRLRVGRSKLGAQDVQLMRESADRIWRFFHDWSSSSTNWLIPDSVRDDGAVELRVSPTNLGMLLNARIAALHLGVIPLSEFVFETRQTLDQIVRMPKHRGHLFNWIDIHSLLALPPLFVSTVDSGNLAASLWTLKQAAIALAAESPVKRGVTKNLCEELRNIAEISDRLVREMDFRFLYQRRKKTLSIGYDVETGKLEAASYNLLASEARMASFIAIAKGDIPQESWFHLGRGHTVFRGEPVLLSWTGTMFEYLMPALWMRHHPDTILDRTMKTAVHTQREYGRGKGVPWGISESAFITGSDGSYGYKAFGVPELAMKRKDTRHLVISPYSTFLAAAIDPAAAVTNLRQMQDYGWQGRYGFYESVTYTSNGAEPIRMWMAHHQGMSLLAIVNLLFDNPLRQYFHAEPQVLATELLLHERVPSGALTDLEQVELPMELPMEEALPAPA